MGYSIANEAKKRGENRINIGPTSIKAPKNVELIKVNTTEEMFNAVEKHFWIVMY